MSRYAIESIPAASADAWMRALNQCAPFDFYHLPEYHRLAELRGEGTAMLLAFAEGAYRIALPLLIRPVTVDPAGEDGEGDWRDATSVYGYAGPIASHTELPAALLARFHEALHAHLAAQRIVALFTRCHTLLSQKAIIGGLGELVPVGRTVSIDLGADEQELLRQYRSNHRTHINRLRRMGARLVCDEREGSVEAFSAMYHETMARVGAAASYTFDAAYFQRLLAHSRGAAHLLMIELDGQPICGGIFTCVGGIAQYHLSGSAGSHLRLSPAKLLVHEAALWARRQGAQVLHLGGGVGAREDPLFHFKADFSDRRHDFYLWRWVLLPRAYQELVGRQDRLLRQHGLARSSESFFPRYRAPTGSAAAHTPVPSAASAEPRSVPGH